MYHSDYESDWEGSIKPKWRAYNSDTEHDSVYRNVKPKLKDVKKRERKPSPPCPHKWESHDDIEKFKLFRNFNWSFVGPFPPDQ